MAEIKVNPKLLEEEKEVEEGSKIKGKKGNKKEEGRKEGRMEGKKDGKKEGRKESNSAPALIDFLN